MTTAYYLVFGDIHGKLLPAFKLAMAWQREHDTPLSGLLQVGDLGFFPDSETLDKATARHAKDDPLELGVQKVTEPSDEADEIFYGKETPPAGMWFTAGNHEDFKRLKSLEQAAGTRANSFPVDYYLRTRCIRDGHVETLPGSLRVGALWGIDSKSPKARTKTPPLARIQDSSAIALACAKMDVVLTHDSPRDAVMRDSGSEEISDVLRSARPAFAFFGHYGSRWGRVFPPVGSTLVYQMAGLELKYHGGSAEEGSVGLLSWDDSGGEFRYLEPTWLNTFTRGGWRWR